jgi:hypothetical protein
MSTIDAQQSQVNNQRTLRHKRWTIAFGVIFVLVLLCVLAFCILGAIGIIVGSKPKTKPVFYQDASINHMLDACNPKRYWSWEDWMVPVPGNDIVMSLNYSKSGPAPEAFYGYTLFIQIDPDLVVMGQELSFPGDKIQPFLLVLNVAPQAGEGSGVGV